MKLIFFNQYHNGDCYVGKGWVRNIINQMPKDVDFIYSHGNHPDIVKDLGCIHLPIDRINSMGISNKSQLVTDQYGNIYINTWCGAFQGELFGWDEHSNFIVQHVMYSAYCNLINQATGLEIHQSNNPYDYLPFIDFSYYNTKPADEFVNNLNGRDLVVFCNGRVMSGQCGLGNMKNIVDEISDRFPDTVFVVTEDVDIKKSNVYNTNDIFKQKCDLNEIAYLTKFAKLIVGKNSGPATYSLYQDNLKDANKTFFWFGTKLTDCPPAGLEFPAKFKFSSQIDNAAITNMLSRTLMNLESGLTGMQHIII